MDIRNEAVLCRNEDEQHFKTYSRIAVNTLLTIARVIINRLIQLKYKVIA